ncbi:MAG: hypothetical protein ACOC10_07195 [Bacteroidota bacterium]
MSSFEKAILLLILMWTAIGLVRWHYYSKNKRERELDRRRPHFREMNKTEF